MRQRIQRWITALDSWEERVTDFPHYPGWLSVSVAVTWAVAGLSLVLALAVLLLFNLAPGLVSLVRPLQPLGEVLGALVASLMILSMILFLLFLLHVMIVLLTYTFIGFARGTLNSLLSLAHWFR